MKFQYFSSVLAAASVSAASLQSVLNFKDTVLAAPQNILQTVTKHNEFTTLVSKDPAYALRIKEVDPSKLGIDTVNQWSRYLDADKKHFFYWFFESRNDPANDPVILWLNGGPGCSSFTGLFFELGPSSIDANLKPVHNPFSWNNNASVIFLEQPVGVGFSYGDEKVSSTKTAGKDVYMFLDLFFQKFPHLVKNDFHISGESYAGHYLPQIAHEIVNHEDRIFNLTSVLIGNGITDTLVQSAYYEPMACGEGGHPAVISKKECQKMHDDLPKCQKLVQACYNTDLTLACVLADNYCNSMSMDAYEKTGLNVYDIRIPCGGENSDSCYIEQEYIDSYMNLPEVQKALGSEVSKYEGCSEDVFSSFTLTGDGAKPFQQYVAEVLEKDIPVLIYAGDKDFICNWLGNLAWTDALEWKNKGDYADLPMQPMVHEGEAVGEFKSSGGLTFLRVYGAGHMVPHDQPVSSLEMVNRWISDFSF